MSTSRESRIGLDSSAGLSRETLVSTLKDPKGDRYDTFANGELTPVVLRKCPRCPATDYVTTTSEHTRPTACWTCRATEEQAGNVRRAQQKPRLSGAFAMGRVGIEPTTLGLKRPLLCQLS